MGQRNSEEEIDAAFFVTPMQVEKPYIYLEGSDVNHMKMYFG
mgnify:CR=1 FL=1